MTITTQDSVALITVPIINLCNANFSSAFSETDSGGRGMSKNIPTYRLLGISLKAGEGRENPLKLIINKELIVLPHGC